MRVIQYIKVNHYMNRVAFASGVILALLATVLCLPINSGEQETQAAGVVTDGTVTIELVNDAASVDINVSNPSGTFASSPVEKQALFNVTTDNAAGYTLFISSDNDSGELVNGDNKLDSINSAISASTFDNAAYNGTWGYKPSKLNSVANTNFLPSPTTVNTVLDATDSANTRANSYSIALGARVSYDEAIGKYNKTFIITSVGNMSGPVCDSSKLCVTYDGNGLIVNDAMSNNVNYDSNITTTQETITKYAHTPNINDSGAVNGTYDNSIGLGKNTRSIVTIPGASSLHIKLTYQTEGDSWDWTSFWAGNYSSYTAQSNYSTGVKCGGYGPKYGGTTKRTVECDITGDTVTFSFRNDSYRASNYTYGYYAIITGTVSTTTGSRTVSSGEYVAPTDANAVFHGWSSTQTTPGVGLPSQVEYTDESAVMSNIPGNNGDTKTLYAVWQGRYPITFAKDDNVVSIDVLDSSGNVVDTITNNGASVLLYRGSTYTIKPTYATRYAPNTFSRTFGEGTLSGDNGYSKTFIVGAGVATINITSQYVDTPMQNYNCTNLASIGDTAYVYDNRDDEVYMVGKLIDGKCWLLDNLRLDLVVHKNDLSSLNTNASDDQLNYLINGNGTTTDQWPTSGVSYWTNVNYSIPQLAIRNTSNENWNPDTISSVTYGKGSGKIGIYYNFCAASAGSYCWGNGTSYTGSPSSDPKPDTGYDIDGDICPAGWRIATGGSADTSVSPNNGEYRLLYTAYSSDAISFRDSLSTSLTGSFSSSSASSQGSAAYFWSSSIYDNWRTYDLAIQPSVGSTSYYNRGYGISVRCKLMPSVSYSLNYDKNTTDSVSNMPSNPEPVIIQSDFGYNITISTDSIPSRSGYIFAGWGTSADQIIPTYKYENNTFTPASVAVTASDNLKTLYAIWHSPQDITFTFDNNVAGVEIRDYDNSTVATITNSGSSVTLRYPFSYTIVPSYAARYAPNTISKASGEGTLTGNDDFSKTFTVGAGAATISITSREAALMQNYNCASLTNVGDKDFVYDSRDNELYLIGKLADNTCWMLENLNLAGGTALSATDTDVTNAYISSFSTSNNLTKSSDTIVLPASATKNANNDNLTDSAQFSTNNYSYIFNSGDKSSCSASDQNTPCYSYYSWDAATLGSGRTLSTNAYIDWESADATQSICPKGWRLPRSRSNADNWQTISDFYMLAHQYGLDTTTNDSESDNGFYTQAGPGTTPNFLLTGRYDSGLYSYGYGYYWSSTAHLGTTADILQFNSSSVYSARSDDRYRGLAVRCLLNEKQNVTLTWDSGVTEVSVKIGSRNIVGTLNSSNTSITLERGITYTISPTYRTRYAPNLFTKTSGEGTLSGINGYSKTFTVGTGDATINITSQYVDTQIQNYNCTSLAYTGDTTYLYDNRDNEVYRIGKLADGKCWLLDNLRLDLTNSTIVNNLSTSNTNVDSNSLTSLRSGNRSAGDQYATAGLSLSNWASSYSYSVPLVNMDNKDIIPRNAPNNGGGGNRVGGYYNYCAASAGSYCYGSGTSSSDPSENNAAWDICPKGWRMPTGGSDGEYGALANAIYGSTSYTQNETAATNYRNALSLPSSGDAASGSAINSLGVSGRFWSATKNRYDRMYVLLSTIGTNYWKVDPQSNYERIYGSSVRCVLPEKYNITFAWDSHVANVNILSGSTIIGTLSSSNTSILLEKGSTYTIAPTYTSGYTTDTITKTVGVGTLSDTQFTAGNGTATINITSKQITIMQNLDSSLCVAGSPLIVMDSRDGEEYLVRRLADGKCWLLDNLRLDISDASVQANLTSVTTNATNTSLGHLKNGNGSSPYATAGVIAKTTNDSWVSSYTTPYIATSGTEYGGWTKNTTFYYSYGVGSGKIGVYYNYCAASAGSYCYDQGQGTGDASEDICPAGWKMPTGGSSGEYAVLNSYYGSNYDDIPGTTTSIHYNLSVPLSGHFDSDGSFIGQDMDGDFWSYTKYEYDDDMYEFNLNSTHADETLSRGRDQGNSVRCVLDS